MAIKYKGNILESLKERGYPLTRLRNERLFGQKTIQDFRKNAIIPYQTINRLCTLLDCQPADIMEYVPDEQAAPTADTTPESDTSAPESAARP